MERLYLLTGAAGNLGNNVAHELVSRGALVRALVLPGDKAAKLLPKELELFEGDVLDCASLRGFFVAPPETELYVIHCAGIVSIGWNYNKRVHAVNVEGTRNVVSQCVASHVKKLVYVSSVHALPELPHGQVITEVDDFDPAKIKGFYGKTKAEASQIVLRAVREEGLDASIVFPGGLCGPNDLAGGNVTQLLIDACRGRLPAGVNGGYDFVDVRDVAAGIANCCTMGKKGEGYILANRYISVRELLHCVHEQAGTREVRRMLPTWVACMALPFFSLGTAITKRKPLFTRYSLYTLRSNSAFSHEKAAKELGFRTRPFRETIADALAWLRSEGKV